MKERELYVADKQSDCIHFTGTMDRACKAGVVYEDVRVRHDPKPTLRGSMLGVSLPCVGSLNPSNAICEKRECWTAEAAGRKYDEGQEAATLTLTVAALIVEKFEKDGEEHSTVECPKCHNAVRYNCAKRGRGVFMMARCQTEGCVGFMT